MASVRVLYNDVISTSTLINLLIEEFTMLHQRWFHLKIYSEWSKIKMKRRLQSVIFKWKLIWDLSFKSGTIWRTKSKNDFIVFFLDCFLSKKALNLKQEKREKTRQDWNLNVWKKSIKWTSAWSDMNLYYIL
jgi:hypothetical protein